MKNIAVVLAGGTGSRMGAPMPKQFLSLKGRAVIEYPIETFCSHPAIDEVAVVVHPDWRSEFEAIAVRNQWPKLVRIVDGGSERFMSTLNAVMAFIDEPDDTNLLFHDAARPLVSAAIVDRVVEALKRHKAVGVGVPCTDTVWEVHPDMSGDWDGTSAAFEVPRFVARIPERRLMWQAQTPQAFRLPTIRDAYQRALQDPQFHATDDCGVVRRYMPEVKVHVVEGCADNFKITVEGDLKRAESVIDNR